MSEHSSSISVRIGLSSAALDAMHVCTELTIVARCKESQVAPVHESQLCSQLLPESNAHVSLALPFLYRDPCINDYILRASLSEDAWHVYACPLGASCREYDLIRLALINLSYDV